MRLDRIVLLYLLSKFNGTEAFTFHPHVKPVPKIPCGSLKPKLNMAMWIPDPLITPHFTQGVVVSLAQATALLLFNQKSLTKAGLFHATILSIGLWTFLRFEGWFVCVLYLIFGSLVTKVKMAEKEALGIAEKRGGARGPENVWGAAATAMVCAALTYVLPTAAPLLRVGYVASLATKLSDTFASEIGKAYGKTTYLITSFRRVPRGTEGAVSLEGTVAGVVGSALMVLAGLLLHQITMVDIVPCLVAAFVATTAESYIGAIFQDSIPWLSNELVNLINTVIGALVGMGLAMALH